MNMNLFLKTEAKHQQIKIWFKFLSRIFPGLILCSFIAILSIQLGGVTWLARHGLSALTIAILLGMFVGNTFHHKFALSTSTGIDFSKKTLLRLGIIFYGLRLTTHDIAEVGLAGVITDAVIVCSTFGLAYILGSRFFGLDEKTTILIGAGSSICGAAAVLAAEPVVEGRAEQVTVAVATVVVFGTLAMFLYPALYIFNQHAQIIPGSSNQFGIYIGSTIHEVAQVVVAGNAIDSPTADIAVITKMVRVMMLAPFLVCLSLWLSRRKINSSVETNNPTKIMIPWFAVYFIGVVLFNSLHVLPSSWQPITTLMDTFLLAIAMSALGISTHISSIKKAGIRPLLLALILFIWLVVGGAFINRFIFTLF